MHTFMPNYISFTTKGLRVPWFSYYCQKVKQTIKQLVVRLPVNKGGESCVEIPECRIFSALEAGSCSLKLKYVFLKS